MKEQLYNLTNPQKNIWNTEEYFKGTTINNICASDIIYENIDKNLLQQAMNNIVRENDNFRIEIQLENDVPMQKITDFKPFDVEVAHIKDESEVKIIENEGINHKFNVLESPLYHFKIFIFENGFGGFVLTVHHLISDSWSMGLVAQNIIQEYHSLKNNEILEETADVSYIQYINSEAEYKESQKYEKDKAYWSEVFASIPENASIPSNNKSYNSFSCNAKRNSFLLDTEIVQNIRTFCENSKISVFNFLMSVYAIYIGKVSNLDDLVIGTPILNRTNRKEKQTMGMFVNTIPVRINIPNNEKFNDFTHLLSSNMISILKHQKYSYNQILEDVRSKHSNVPNLYNILISYQITKALNKEYGNYKTDWIFNNYNANDLSIHISDLNDTGSLLVSYDYLIDKYNEKDINALHLRVMGIINQILNNENILTNDIEIITEEEKNKILYEFNNTKVDYDKTKTLSMMFEEQVKKTPNNVALVFENQELTFKELNEKANSLAYYLRNKKIGRDDVVGVMCNRSLEMIISILAVIKSGSAYTPIDPTYPKDRIEYMLNSSNSKMLLTQKHLDSKIEFKNKVFVDLDNNTIYDLPKENLEHINSPEDLAYIIFTSGSTGLPKGVMLMHKALSNLTNYCNNYIEYLKNPSDLTVVSTTTMSFDIFFFETIISLQKGLKLVIANENEQNMPQALNSLIEKHDIKIIQATPSRMQMFINNIDNMPALKNLKYITLAGEQLPANLVNTLHELSGAIVYNGYGPSETTVFSTLTKMENEFVTIGKPLYNTQIYILDKNLYLVPIGTSGEIYISGDGVGKGYLNSPDLTKKSFIQNPYNPGTIMYKTGDLGMYTDNGDIICLGRADHQIKIRGQRIELGEIEDTLSKLPGVKSCVVVKYVNEKSHEALCAYFTAENNIDSNTIYQHLEKSLPKYMIPQYFTQLESLPYTPNGKIDRKKLPKPQINNTKTKIIPPRNDIDAKLIEILKDLLNVDSISLDDSFSNLGGDSLSAINLCVKVQNEFKSELLVRDVLEHSIIQDLSDIISQNINTSKKQVIKKTPKLEYYITSSAQKRIFFASQMAGNTSTLYNTPAGIVLEGKIDPIKLENCINSLINRQESLRTCFDVINGNVVQKVLENVNFKLDILDNAIFEDLDTIFKDFVKPFDLSKAPLLRAKFITFTNGKSALIADMHHIISDGASMSIFIDELCRLYNGDTLPENSITYKDYSIFENERLASGDLNEAEKYWINQFQDEIPILDLPTNCPRPAIQSFEGKKLYSLINEDMVKQIEELSKKLNITPYMLLLSIYYILLSKYTSSEDIVVGSPIVGRDVLETQNIIGMFVNTLALREHVDNALSFTDFVLNVKENLLNSYKYQTYPFDELVNKLNIKRDTSRNPLFDTLFTYQNNVVKKIDFDGITADFFMPDVNISKFDLSLEAIPYNNKIKLSFEYATKLFDEDFIKNLSNHYINILNVVLENADIKISDICMLSNEEQNKILYEFNDTKVDFPRNKTVALSFEEQAQKTPDNIAVVFENQQLTYKELNEKANSLARYLRNNGIGRNDLVGIMVTRSLEMIVSILAVLKAGGAYIPIDPTYPKDRIDYMLSSSNSKILLTQEKLDSKIEFDNKVFVDLSNSSIYSLPNSNLESINEPDDLFYVIFTSGSTGRPKGVMIMHKTMSNFMNYCNNYIDYLKNPIYQAIVSITTISFDIFVFETIISLQRGLKLVIANENQQTTPLLLNELIEKHNIKIIQSTPSIMQIFLNNINDMPSLKELKYMTFAGEQLPLNLVNNLHKLSDVVIYNGYGPSETYYATLTKMGDEFITIGKPLDNTQIYILDKYLKPVPIGVTGELYISGDGVAKGYLNNPELTKKSFIPNPYIPGTIMYKSGDLGVFTNDGNILCLGRVDHQIKIRGQRIELEEIESLILKYPNIKKATVVKQSVQNREFISAYFVADKRIIVSELRKYLSHTLPRYMVPSYFTALDDFPYTPNGKIDRKALPLPTEISNTDNENYVAPKTALQRQLVNIWEKVLNITPIGINDNFFELGGDSILAMNLSIELLKVSNKIGYSDIFRFPTIAEQEEKMNSDNNNLMFNKIENLSDSSLGILNNCTKKEKIKNFKPKGILLTGATGFLGIHILEEFIKNETCNIYCIVREEPGLTAKTKLKQKLNYYFGNKYDNLLDNRIIVVTGSTSKEFFGLNQEELSKISDSVDVVINSAARVTHFGNYDDFYISNVASVKYIIDFCKKFNKKLYHISTYGVAGTKIDPSSLAYKKNKQANILFNETSLYVGQVLDGVYTRSKFEAERLVLEAVSCGLDGYILRMGNLMPRYSDSVFQENILDNAFVNKLATFIKIGIIPDYMLKELLEFTPIDCAANGIYKLVTHPTKTNRIFHLFNHHYISASKYVKFLKKMNYEIKILPEKEFKDKINVIIQNEDSKNSLNNLISDFDKDLHLDFERNIIIKSNFTINYLKKTHFKWPKISKQYLIKFINLLREVL